jgi:hypothetical protein
MSLYLIKEIIMHMNPRRILLTCLVLATLPALPGCGVTGWQRQMDALQQAQSPAFEAMPGLSEAIAAERVRYGRRP